jgi:hypothetical protein
MSATASLIVITDLFCAARGLSRSRVSTLVFNDGKTLQRIADGGDLNTRSYERALGWFSANWPEGVAWPAGIERPGTAAAGGGAGEREAV